MAMTRVVRVGGCRRRHASASSRRIRPTARVVAARRPVRMAVCSASIAEQRGAICVRSVGDARKSSYGRFSRRPLRPIASGGAATVGPSSEQGGEQGDGGICWASMRVPVTAMAGSESLGSSGSMMGATLERTSPTFGNPKQKQELKTETGGGSGGIGKNIHNGGGGGDDEDDDDYEFGDDEGGDEPEPIFVKPEALPEVYDRLAIDAVLAEWYRCLADLPAGLRMAVEMSFVSTSQLVRFLSMECRPTIARAVSRRCPTDVSRALVGRMMADPQFVFKLAVEEALTVYGSLTYEAERRGKRFFKELDMVALNTASLMMATFGTAWVLAPSRSFGAAYKFKWQSMLHGLPNQMFEKSTPLRNYTGVSRSLGMAVKGAQLACVGAAIGASNTMANSALVKMRRAKSPEYEPVMDVPSVRDNAGGMAAVMGLSGTIRYNALGGFERLVSSRVGKLGHIQIITALGRVANGALGDGTRLHWVGMPKRGSKIIDPDRPLVSDSFASLQQSKKQ